MESKSGFDYFEDVSDRVTVIGSDIPIKASSRLRDGDFKKTKKEKPVLEGKEGSKNMEYFIWCHLKTKFDPTEDINQKVRDIIFVETQLNQMQKNHCEGDNKYKMMSLHKKITKIPNAKNVPIFIAGDFNQTPKDAAIRLVMEKGFVDCFSLKNLQGGELEDKGVPVDQRTALLSNKANQKNFSEV